MGLTKINQRTMRYLERHFDGIQIVLSLVQIHWELSKQFPLPSCETSEICLTSPKFNLDSFKCSGSFEKLQGFRIEVQQRLILQVSVVGIELEGSSLASFAYTQVFGSVPHVLPNLLKRVSKLANSEPLRAFKASALFK
ncbi:hypothetical protein CDAR_482331 [Caerostris darwini]|uniref:Uncharacterized protein n=1 Tax=Caerostris darwini TaxID=1538125 RepID=A0AAV4TFK2_9ARAC|nr:hypothetical protein CDAR_482331 [Caerostris darwini]